MIDQIFNKQWATEHRTELVLTSISALVTIGCIVTGTPFISGLLFLASISFIAANLSQLHNSYAKNPGLEDDKLERRNELLQYSVCSITPIISLFVFGPHITFAGIGLYGIFTYYFETKPETEFLISNGVNCCTSAVNLGMDVISNLPSKFSELANKVRSRIPNAGGAAPDMSQQS